MTFDEAVAKGTVLHDAMNATPEAAKSTQSQFKDPAELTTYGWYTYQNSGQRLCHPDDDLGLWRAYNGSAISNDAVHNVLILTSHTQESSHPPTEASYTQVYNIPGHTICAKRSISPANSNLTPQNLVPLQHWSDVTYLEWANLAPDAAARKDLRHVIQCSIENYHIEAVVDEVLKKANKTLERWPGTKFTPESDLESFKALLGTPNGRGTAYMLSQRKGEDELGWKVVESITVWIDRSLVDEGNVDRRRLYMMLDIGERPLAKNEVSKVK